MIISEFAQVCSVTGRAWTLRNWNRLQDRPLSRSENISKLQMTSQTNAFHSLQKLARLGFVQGECSRFFIHSWNHLGEIHTSMHSNVHVDFEVCCEDLQVCSVTGQTWLSFPKLDLKAESKKCVYLNVPDRNMYAVLWLFQSLPKFAPLRGALGLCGIGTDLKICNYPGQISFCNLKWHHKRNIGLLADACIAWICNGKRLLDMDHKHSHSRNYVARLVGFLFIETMSVYE